MNLEQRITRLEEMVSIQQDEMLSISKELYAQHQENQRLKEQLIRLNHRMKEASQGDLHIRPIHEETPPPHY